jgi:CRISPR-associated protein Cmr1
VIITRFSKQRMTELTCEVEFLTPTFLGGADQNAELRAAPFKNLLRQWWRVAFGYQFSKWQDMLSAEDDLFGSVRSNSAGAGKVRISFTGNEGNYEFSNNAMALGTTHHPEAGNNANGMNVDNALYLGFGPITYQRGQKPKRYIVPGSKARLAVICPKGHITTTIITVLQYINSFGTIGSRSRNGWGSLALSGEGFTSQPLTNFPVRPLPELLAAREYPSSLGEENDLLCWEIIGQQGGDWTIVMQHLAEFYMNLRTGVNIAPQGLQKRHILGYPVTHHYIDSWGGRNGRMPSQLRLMVKRNLQGNLVGRILHLPHKLPRQWDVNRLGTELSVWREIHRKLDQNNQLQRVGGNQ